MSNITIPISLTLEVDKNQIDLQKYGECTTIKFSLSILINGLS